MLVRSLGKASIRALSALACAVVAHAQSPYAGQESRAIKAPAPEEIRRHEGGKGMGFAKTAELNGYPGPAHVLELAAKLELSAEQRERTEALFRRMEADAIAHGRRLVEEERLLDATFADRSVTPSRSPPPRDASASCRPSCAGCTSRRISSRSRCSRRRRSGAMSSCADTARRPARSRTPGTLDAGARPRTKTAARGPPFA